MPADLVIVTIRVRTHCLRYITGVAGGTTFSSESGKYPDSFWQGIADGARDWQVRQSRLVSSLKMACAVAPRQRDTLPCPAAVAHRHPARCARPTEGLPCQSTGGGNLAGGTRPRGTRRSSSASCCR